VATIPSYLYACREVVLRVVQGDEVELPPNPTINAKVQSILMEGSNLGEKVTCKSSKVGRNARASSRCCLNHVIVMDNVQIGENCVLQISTLGAGCVIGKNCDLNDCQAALGQRVPTGTKEKGGSLMDGCSVVVPIELSYVRDLPRRGHLCRRQAFSLSSFSSLSSTLGSGRDCMIQTGNYPQ
jgi:carbonic anhydrase/acetyltransferase-like protein (isoleucine patch superfamily)